MSPLRAQLTPEIVATVERLAIEHGSAARAWRIFAALDPLCPPIIRSAVRNAKDLPYPLARVARLTRKPCLVRETVSGVCGVIVGRQTVELVWPDNPTPAAASPPFGISPKIIEDISVLSIQLGDTVAAWVRFCKGCADLVPAHVRYLVLDCDRVPVELVKLIGLRTMKRTAYCVPSGWIGIPLPDGDVIFLTFKGGNPTPSAPATKPEKSLDA